MKITVFTSNQPRHLHLIESLSKIANEVFAVLECNTVFPGLVKDFYDNSDIMKDYFSKVIDAEEKIFGKVKFLSKNINFLAVKSGDLNKLSLADLNKALKSNFYIIFGSSFIKGELVDFLIRNKAVNIHMGISPYYRGSSCNFWAMYDGNPELVGATIHMLSKELDSGEILYHALPKPQIIAPFLLGMEAVKVAHDSLCEKIKENKLFEYEPISQDKSKEIRYTRNKDFTDDVANTYLSNLITEEQIYNELKNRNLKLFKNPVFR